MISGTLRAEPFLFTDDILEKKGLCKNRIKSLLSMREAYAMLAQFLCEDHFAQNGATDRTRQCEQSVCFTSSFLQNASEFL